MAIFSEQVARAWVNFNGEGTLALRDNYNVSSVTDNGTGDYTINYSVSMSNDDYCVVGLSGDSASNANQGVIFGANASLSTGSCRIRTGSGGGYNDNYMVMIVIYGDS
tara:strand:- start:322 stop:645 length:324 start_codon:yes stop_codon:yes gene_type:complete